MLYFNHACTKHNDRTVIEWMDEGKDRAERKERCGKLKKW
jgi:hypothetical protein